MDTMTTFTTINGMDSRDIAKDTDKNHADVCRDIRRMLEELGGGGESRFASSYLSAQNKPVRCYMLPKRECLILATGYSVVLRAKIIDRWAELESGIAVPLGSKAYHQIFMDGFMQGKEHAISTLERFRVLPIKVGRPRHTDVSRHAPTEKVGGESKSGFSDDGTFLLPGMVEAVKGAILKFAGEETTMTAIFEHVRIPRSRTNEMGVAYLLKSNGYERFHKMSKGIRTWVYRMAEHA